MLLAEAAAKRKVEAQPLNTMVTCHLQPHDPTAKLLGRLVRRIENLEFLEMAEMLPETWASLTPTL